MLHVKTTHKTLKDNIFHKTTNYQRINSTALLPHMQYGNNIAKILNKLYNHFTQYNIVFIGYLLNWIVSKINPSLTY